MRFGTAIAIGITVVSQPPRPTPSGATIIITGGSSGSIRTTSTCPIAEEVG
jgi:hypothetical protein